jgi:predicted amidohydrolase
MKVTAIQFRRGERTHAEALSELVELADEAGPGQDLIVLPEMAATGYIFADADAVAPWAEPADGPTFAALSAVAKRHHTWIVAGFPEVDGGRLYNSALVINRDGALAFVYRKTLLYTADETWALPGDSGYRSFDTGAGRFAVGICMDLNDDRFIRWLHADKPDVLAFPTNWVDEGTDVWTYWVSRLWGAGLTLVAANTWGHEGGTDFSGRSVILHELVAHAHAPKAGDGHLSAKVPLRSRH